MSAVAVAAATLAELGLDDEVLNLASAATADPSGATNPRPLDDAAHRDLLEQALRGGLGRGIA